MWGEGVSFGGAFYGGEGRGERYISRMISLPLVFRFASASPLPWFFFLFGY